MLLVVSFALAVTLDEAWAAAASQGVDSALVREQYAAAKTLRGAAWSLVSPKLVARGNYTRNDEELTFDSSALIPPEFAEFVEPTEPMVVQKLEYFDANLSLVQPLFSGKALPLLRAAYGEVGAAEQDERAGQIQVRLGVAQAYWGAVVAREAVKIAEDALASARKHREMLETAVVVGTLPPTARLQAEIAASRAARDLATAEEARVTAQDALARLTGLEASVTLERPAPRALPYLTSEAAISAAEERQPAIRAARERVRSARFQRLARGLDWLPEVNGRFTYVWTENTTVFSDRPEFWMAVVEGEWVLWDGGYRLSEQAKAAAISRMATLAETRALDAAAAEIRTLWARRDRAQAALDAVRREVELAGQNARIAEVAFAAGAITFLELEDARLGERAARLAELQEAMASDLAALALLGAAGDL